LDEPWYEIVDAAEQDMDLILELATTASIFTFNALRSTTQERSRYMQAEFVALKRWVRQGQYRFLVARDKEINKSIGYLLLNLWSQDDIGRRQTFVEDIAALPEYWGRGVGHALFDAATEVTAQLGIDFMGGEVSATNPRWQAALRNRFELEAYRVVRACTPRGKEMLEQVKQAREAQEKVEEQLRASRERRQASRRRRQEGR
jgi:GNAT superfamily N-acetyltransferase